MTPTKDGILVNAFEHGILRTSRYLAAELRRDDV